MFPVNIVPEVEEVSEIVLEAVLSHGDAEMYRLQKLYSIYPAILKTRPVDTGGKSAAYWGNDRCFDMIKGLIPSCTRLADLSGIDVTEFELVIIGSYIDDGEEKNCFNGYKFKKQACGYALYGRKKGWKGKVCYITGIDKSKI